MTRCAPCRDRRHRCQSCRERRHGEDCTGCCCRCRAMLGLDLFEGGDPTAPGSDDQGGLVA